MAIDSALDDGVEAETDVLKEEFGNWGSDIKGALRYLKGSDKLFMLAAYKLGWIGTQEEHEELIRRAHDEGKVAEYVIGSYGEAVTRGIGSMALYLRALNGPVWLRAVAYPLMAHYVADAYLEIKKNPQKTGSNNTLVGIVRERFAKLRLGNLKRRVVEHYTAHGPVSREEALEAASRAAELDDQEGFPVHVEYKQ